MQKYAVGDHWQGQIEGQEVLARVYTPGLQGAGPQAPGLLGKLKAFWKNPEGIQNPVGIHEIRSKGIPKEFKQERETLLSI